jgi:hypothetical protein
MNILTKSIMSAVALAALAGFTASAGNGPDNPKAASNVAGVQLTVKALQVMTGAPRVLSGAFEIRPPNPGEPSVSSTGFGGACLVAQLPVQAKSCTTNHQCDIVFGHDEPKWGGYCLGGQCWVKPSEDYCLKGVGVGAHSTPAADASAVYAYAAGKGTAPAIKWRVLGCINGVPVSKDSNALAPCPGGPGEAVHDAGQPTVVP